MAKTKKAATIDNEKYKVSLKTFVWNGFNLTVGIAFLGSLNLLVNYKGDPFQQNGGSGLGWHIIWIFLLMGIVVGICAMAFAKLSRQHHQDKNGGAYIFSRSALGTFWGYFVGMINYVLVPLIFANQILNFVKANFDSKISFGFNQDVVFPPGTNTQWDPSVNHWWSTWADGLGGWTKLTFDLIGIVLAVVFSMVAFFGSKIYKKAAKYTLGVKWVTSGILVLFGIISSCLIVNHNNAQNWADHSTISISTFSSAFCACFYYFTGFEMFATAGRNVEKPEKNISKGILLVVGFAVFFYIFVTTIFLLASPSFAQNVNTGFWWLFAARNEAFRWIVFVGPVIMIISTISLRGNTIAQMSLYGGTTLQPLAEDGYISNKFASVDKHGFPIKAMILNTIVVAISMAIWAIIPDILDGITWNSATKESSTNFINFNTIISAASSFYLVLYIVVLLSLLKLSFVKAIKVNAFMKTIYCLVCVLLGFVLVYHYYDLITAFTNSKSGTSAYNSTLAALAIESCFTVMFYLYVYLSYRMYYVNKVLKKINKGSQEYKQKQYSFRVLDGWEFIKMSLQSKTNNFSKRQEKRVYFMNSPKVHKKHEAAIEEMKIKRLRFIHKLEKIVELDYISDVSWFVNNYNQRCGNDTLKEKTTNNNEARKMLVNWKQQINELPFPTKQIISN